MNSIDFPFPNIFLLVWLFALSTFAQTNESLTGMLIERIDSVSKRIASESIYLQTSKGIYETEEDLWFKGYVLNSQYFTPSTSSSTLFVQLIEDKTNKTVWQEKYEIENGFVDGHLYLQDSLLTGSYHLVAFTSHSIFKSTKELDAVREIQIVKKIEHKNNTIHSKKDSIIDFSTFPEGGNLISGMKNKLAFKAVNSRGEPVSVSGTLFENNLPLLNFKSIHEGMGSLDFTPHIDKEYHIKLVESVKERHYTLPEIKRGGINLRLTKTTKDYLLFEITQNAKYSKGNIHFRLQIRGIVYSTATAELKNNLKIKVQLNKLPQGIAEATLYNDNFIPICERLVYVNHDRKLNIQVLVAEEFDTREKATLKIKVTDQNQQPVIAHLGLSIFDRIYQNKKDSKTIESHYYLSSQLKGKLYNPAYYFNEENQDRKEALNLLLLTQGWRRYVWSETNLEELKVTKQILFDDIGGVAKIIEKKKSKKLSGSVIMVFNPELKTQDQFILLDSLGKFEVNPSHLKLGERNYTYFKFMVPPKFKYHFSISNNWFKSINVFRKTTLNNYPIFNIYPLENENIIPFKLYADVKELDEIELYAKKGKVVRDKYLGKLDSIARLDFIDWIAEPCRTLNCPFHPYVKGNELPIEGKSYSQYVATIYSNGEANEILNTVIYVKEKLTDEYLMSRFNLIRIKGYYGKREFYQPVYDKETVNDPFPDYRNTLFWKPDIITNEQGQAVIDFFCSDINSIFLGHIEGVSGSGLLGNESFEFEIKK